MKYVIFALVLIAFVANFCVKTIAQRIWGDKLNDMHIVFGKLICFAIVFTGVLLIIIFN